MKPIENQVLKFIKQNNIKTNKNIVVAFSGGSDSLALLVILSKIYEKERIFPVYVDHNLRSRDELEGEIELNKQNCVREGLTLKVISLDNKVLELSKKRKTGIEECARELRYEALLECAADCEYVFTAHNKDDQIQTVLMRLMGNSALPSLAGIPKINGKIVRPLLDVSHKELREYLIDLGYRWSEDSTNALNDYKRNELRHEILPELRKVYPGYEEAILRIKDHVCSVKSPYEGLKNTDLGISLSLFDNLSELEKQKLLFDYWADVFKTNFRPLRNSLLFSILDAIEASKSVNIESLGAVVSLYQKKLFIFDEQRLKNKDYYYQIEKNIKVQKWNLAAGYTLVKGQGTDEKSLLDSKDIYLFEENLEEPLVIRNAKVCDTIELVGGKKTVFSLLKDMGVPKPLRALVPVICDQKEVVAVFGRCFGASDRICRKASSKLVTKAVNLYIVVKD